MALTPEQQRNRLLVLKSAMLLEQLKSGAISQAEYDAQVNPPKPVAAATTGANSSPRDATMARSAPAGPQASAPYRFVPVEFAGLEHPFIKAEHDALGNIDRPKEDGCCASITLEWTAETPLLIGEAAVESNETQDGTLVTPFRLRDDEPDSYIIPGATLRGAIRSVAEIAAGAMLTQVNKDRLFPLRDFNHAAYRPPTSGIAPVNAAGTYPITLRDKVKAGWLRLKDDHGLPRKAASEPCAIDDNVFNEAFVIEPCDTWFTIEIATIKRKVSTQLPFPADFNEKEGTGFAQYKLVSKYVDVKAQRGYPPSRDAIINPRSVPSLFKLVDNSEVGRKGALVSPAIGGDIKGYHVFSGPAPKAEPPAKPKHLEYVFPEPQKGADDRAAFHAVLSNSMRRFRMLNSDTVDDKLTPAKNWQDAVKAMALDRNVRIPVFYVGDLETQDETGENAFFFGLTRLFKVPHAWPFTEVLEASGHTSPVPDGSERVDPDRLDMVDALFGYVHARKEGSSKLPPAETARKGRVMVSHARLVNPAAVTMSKPMSTVMMGPRPSFAPFYLRPDKHGYADYSGPEKPVISGRKRYLPRETSIGAQDGSTLSRLQARLSRQIDLVKWAGARPPTEPGAAPKLGDGPTAKTLMRLSFLTSGSTGELPRFRSEIRLFNVTKAELGMVLWALTLGGRQETLRHMIGRAKPFGAGQMRVALTKIDIEANGGERTTARHPAEAQELAGPYLASFDAHVLASEVHARGVLTMRARLQQLCDPAYGQSLEAARRLDAMPLSGQQHKKMLADRNILLSFGEVRDRVKPRTDATCLTFGKAPLDD